MRRLLARTFAPRAADLPHLRTDCLLCGLQVVDVGAVTMHFLAVFGPCELWYSDEDLIEMCPLHQLLAQARVAGSDDAT